MTRVANFANMHLYEAHGSPSVNSAIACEVAPRQWHHIRRRHVLHSISHISNPVGVRMRHVFYSCEAQRLLFILRYPLTFLSRI